MTDSNPDWLAESMTDSNPDWLAESMTDSNPQRFMDPRIWTFSYKITHLGISWAGDVCLPEWYMKRQSGRWCELDRTEAQPSLCLWYWFSLADVHKRSLRARLSCVLNIASEQTRGSTEVQRSFTKSRRIFKTILRSDIRNRIWIQS